MGIPPKGIVIPRLIKKYFKPSKFTIDREAMLYKKELESHWEKYGVLHDSPVAITKMKMYDYGYNLEVRRRQQYLSQVKE